MKNIKPTIVILSLFVSWMGTASADHRIILQGNGKLAVDYGLEVIVPDDADRALVHRVIYEELCVGTIEPASREAYREVMARLAHAGAQGIILGCTEISLLVGVEDASVPLFDTTALHANAAAEAALSIGVYANGAIA